MCDHLSLANFVLLFAFFRERDSDKDGKVSFKEFFHGLFDLVRNYDEEVHTSHSSDDSDASAKQLFAQLDKDGDGYSRRTSEIQYYFVDLRRSFCIVKITWLSTFTGTCQT